VQTDAGAETPLVTSDRVAGFLEHDELPTPAKQATNAIRIIGDMVRDSGEALDRLPVHFFASVGCVSPDRADRLVEQLVHRGDVVAMDRGDGAAPPGVRFLSLELSLDGWERYDSERRGKETSGGGFLALKFGDPSLDRFVADVVKPAAESAGYKLVDMRDVKRAGVIDNLMRMEIRDCTFLIADLSHGNNGAYWEAGFAEGLGKPVIYLCEKTIFDKKLTHFDTNHCTTLLWEEENPDGFREEFIATLRNSLRVFDSI
jgi:hypothetical protein